MTFDQISALVLAAPKIEWGLIQNQHALERTKSHRVPGGADAWVMKNAWTHKYRVVLGTEKETKEATRESLLEAIREVFTALNLPIPEFASGSAPKAERTQPST